MSFCSSRGRKGTHQSTTLDTQPCDLLSTAWRIVEPAWVFMCVCVCVCYGDGDTHEWVLEVHGIIILHNVLSYPETRSMRIIACLGFSGGANGKESACQCRRPRRYGFDPWVQEDPLEKGMATHSSFLAWRTQSTESHVSLVGYSP